jgi:hypothetical protein
MIPHGRVELEENVLCSAEGQVEGDRPGRVVEVVRCERRYDDSRHGAVNGSSEAISEGDESRGEWDVQDEVVTRRSEVGWVVVKLMK